MNIGDQNNSHSSTSQPSMLDGTHTLIPTTSIKTEEGVNYFPEHKWDNKAPIFIGQELLTQRVISTTGKTVIFTYFKRSDVPSKFRENIRKQAVEYKKLSDDKRAAYIEERVVSKTCYDPLQPELLKTNGAFAVRDLKAGQLLGHYAGRLKTEDEYQAGAEQLGATRISVDRYSYTLNKELFLSGLCESNVMSLINANNTYKELRALMALDIKDETAIEAAKAEDAAKSPAANVVFVEQRDEKRWVILVVTLEDIAKGEQLFVDYGLDYWRCHEYVENLERLQFFCENCGLVFDNLDFFEKHQQTEHETKNHTTIHIPYLSSRESGRWNLGSETTENVSQCDVSKIVPESSNNSEDNNPIHTGVKCSPTLDTVNQEKPVDSNASIKLGQDDTDDALLQSQSITSKKNYKCNTCGMEYKYKQKLKFHMLTHTDGILSLCYICGKGLKNPYAIKDHVITHTGEKPYQCDICGTKFARKTYLSKHMQIHTGENTYQCDQTVNESYIYKACGKVFKHIGKLKKHLRCHTQEKRFECETCGKAFERAGHLKRHILIHTGEKPYECDMCDMKFRDSGTLSRHVDIHRGTKRHECDICKKKFNQRHSLTTHMRIHTGDKPYKCNICEKRFTQSCNLNHHIINHTGVKPFHCKECGRTFSRKGSLRRHLKIHTREQPYKCDICGERFLLKKILKRHKYIIHKADNTTLDVMDIGNSFKYSGNLNANIHTDPSKCHRHKNRTTHIKCEICGKGFTQRGSLKRHKDTIHKSDNTTLGALDIGNRFKYSGNLNANIHTDPSK